MTKPKEKDGWEEFLTLCLETHDPKMLSLLFDLFFTFEEKESLAARYLIIKALIKAEKPQRQIAKDLNASIAKITRGSNELKRTHAKLLRYLQDKLGCI